MRISNTRITDTSSHFRILSLFWKNKPAIIGLILIIILVFGSVFSFLLAGQDPHVQGDLIEDRFLSPSTDHPFGTDKYGRDVFSRVLYGGRISLFIAVSVVIISMTIGVLYGSISGYFGGRTDMIMMRILDFLLAFPLIFLIITLIAVFKLTHLYLIPLLALTGWMETARLIRAEVLSLKERDFILAAKGFGYNHLRILLSHIIPNCLSIVFVTVPLKVAEVVLLESALSFLGIGVQPPTPSWGNIINDGREALSYAWWVSTFPGIFITFTVMSFYLISDGLKDILHKNS
jgi:peptide/nickel transport system permease protein